MRSAASCASACLRAADACFGHRLMMDVIVPGGVARDIAPDGADSIARRCSPKSRKVFPRLIELYDNTASLQDRTVTHRHRASRTLRASSAPAAMSAAPRAATSMRAARSAIRPMTTAFEVPVLDDGDVNARVWIRIREVEQSLSLIEQILDALPAGRRSATALEATREACEGMALVEAFRGDVLVWLRLDARRPHRALPSARSVLVPVAAAGSRDRGQHRRRLPALQQIVQLLLFGARSLGCACADSVRKPHPRRR